MLQRIALFVSIFAFVVCTLGQTPPDIGIEGGEIRVEPAKNGAAVARTVIFFAPAVQGQAAPTLSLRDVKLDDAVIVAFGTPQPISTARGYEWTTVATVTGLPEGDYEALRVGEARLDTEKRSFRYTLTNKPKVSSWTATANIGKVVWTSNKDLPIVVTANGGGGRDVSVLRSTLTDASTANSITPNRFKLCDASTPATTTAFDADCTAPVMQPGKPTTAYVRIDGDNIKAGNYNGAVELQIAGSSQPQSLSLAFSRSSACLMRWGVGAIALGVLVSAFVGVFARSFAARGAAILPATRLADMARARLTMLDSLGFDDSKMSNLRRALNAILEALTKDKVKGFVGSWIPSPFATNATASSAFATYLQERSDRLKVLNFLMDTGVLPAMAEGANKPGPLAVALKHLDRLAIDPAMTIEALRTEIARILALLRDPATKLETVERVDAPLPSTRQLLVTIDTVNLGVWLVWMSVTIVLGTAVLILTNPGFGTGIDFVKCFFWGLGTQIAGDQLAQMRASSATTALGITLPG